MRVDKFAITLHLRAPDGRQFDLAIAPDTNALFFSFEVAKELLGPFYTARKGLDGAQKLFAGLKQRQKGPRRPLPLIQHTDWCDLI
jgi:hypothetical protein